MFYFLSKFLIGQDFSQSNVFNRRSRILYKIKFIQARLTNRFCYGKRFLHAWGEGGGGGLHKNVSQILAIIDFFKQRNYRKNLLSKEEYYRQHNFEPNKSFKLGQIRRRQLHSRLPIGTICINYRPTRLGLGSILRVIYIGERTNFKLIIDFKLERFQAGGGGGGGGWGRWGLRERCKKRFLEHNRFVSLPLLVKKCTQHSSHHPEKCDASSIMNLSGG